MLQALWGRLAGVVGSALALGGGLPASKAQEQNQPPSGFEALFNGQDLKGWHGERTMNPARLQALSKGERKNHLLAWDRDARQHWSVKGGELINDGFGVYLTSNRQFADAEFWVGWKIVPGGDSGVYLRATPQVQIWDPAARVQNTVGSGGLYNNQKHRSTPLVQADRPAGEWNRFHILQTGSRTSVWLNGKLVVDHTLMENYWDRSRPLFPRGPIQLQTHGGEIHWRNIFARQIPRDEANRILAAHGEQGFEPLFNGKDLQGWSGALHDYEVRGGAIQCRRHRGGVLYSHDTYGDFVVRLEIKLPPGGNNGLAIRYPGTGDPAYAGMCELQVLDNKSSSYIRLDPRQYHGSAYGMVPAHRGYLRQVGEWNFQEVTVKGSAIRVELNGYEILNTDLKQVTTFMANHPHPGKDLLSGHFGFAGHSDPVAFRHIRIKRLD